MTKRRTGKGREKGRGKRIRKVPSMTLFLWPSMIGKKSQCCIATGTFFCPPSGGKERKGEKEGEKEEGRR